MRSEAMGKTMAIFLVMAMIATGIALFPTGVEATTQSYTIKGTVLNNVGDAPLAGVTVAITVDSAPIKTETVTTLSDGTFSKVFMLDNPYNFTVKFNKTGFETRLPGDTRLFPNTTFVSRVADTNITLLYPKPIVKGKVYESGTSTPIQDVKVSVEGNAEPVFTDSNGRFSDYTNSDNVDITFHKNGYYSTSVFNVDVVDSSYDDMYYMEKIVPEPTIKVWGIVFNTTDARVPGALVSITEGQDKWITTVSDLNGYYEMMAYPGNYQIKASKEDYFTTFDQEHFFNVPSDKPVRENITLQRIGNIDRWFNGTVSCSDGGNVSGASATLYSSDGRYKKSFPINWTGVYSIEFYAQAGVTFTLAVEKKDYFTDVSYKGFTAGNTGQDVVLDPVSPDHTLSGFVYDAEGNKVIPGASVTIYSRTKLYTNAVNTGANGYYEFDVTDGESFFVVFDADGFQSEMRLADNIVDDMYIEIGLAPSGADEIVTTYNFVNWSTIQVTRARKLDVDNVTARFETDRKLGMGDIGLDVNNGILSPGEREDWEKFLARKGTEKRNTKDILTIDNRHYELIGNYTVTVEGAEGNIWDANSTIFINSTYNYTLVGQLENPDGDQFTLVLNCTYDTKHENNVHKIYINDFEMTSNTTDTAHVTVTGYNRPITIDPKIHDGDMETVTMTIERSMNGTAKAKLITGVHHVLNSSYENYTAIVPMGPSGGTNTTVTFSAEDSTDPVGSISKANFTWDFGDGEMGYGITVKHNYTNASHDGELMVRLVIEEVGGTISYRNITLWVDSQKPTAIISANLSDANISLAGTVLTVNEDAPITFNGTASHDSIKGTDRKGIIEKWYWSWGDDESFDETVTRDGNQNITHTYREPGTYILNMTATDVVGRESDVAQWTVRVLDITAPQADFFISNEEGLTVTEVIENRTFYFNASSTIDNHDERGDMDFEWFFDVDGTVTAINGTAAAPWLVNYTFNRVGMFNVTVKVTDSAGNTQNKTMMVYSNLDKRPNILMKLGSMEFTKSPGTAGKAMTISVNITNDGLANATNIQTRFYIRDADGSDKEIGSVTTSFLGIGETETVEISWTPKKKGEYSIWANATCPGEHSSQWWDNKIDDFSVQKVTVKEAAWVIPAIVISIVAVVIVVFIGMRYFMKSGTEKEDTGDKRKKR